MGHSIEAEVCEDGMVHVIIPGIAPGNKVWLEVNEQPFSVTGDGSKRIGWLKGVIEVYSSFDDPIVGLP